VPDTGGKARLYMNRKITYSDESIGEVKIVKDFLPSPEELVFREDSVKVTISLSKKSVDFFKVEADRHHTQYQRMIRNLLDAYVDTHKTRVG
jgi:predicted DNA binding CopG/RHH family protein